MRRVQYCIKMADKIDDPAVHENTESASVWFSKKD